MPDYRRTATLLQQASTFLRRLLPGCCALCSSHSASPLCPDCIRQFFMQPNLRCPVCARAMPHALQTIVCGTCLSEPPAFDATIAACDYAAPADHLVQNLKFHAQLALAPAFSQRISHAWRQQQHDSAVTQLPALMTAVPLSGARLAARGFNQALEIAKPLARDLGISLVPQLCLRTRDTQAQAALSMAQRQVNMRGAFVVAPEVKASVQQRHVFVVDDVITTGHTLNALATCLKRWGAARVTNLVFSRTPTHGN